MAVNPSILCVSKLQALAEVKGLPSIHERLQQNLVAY
jgi:hypothetical protein